MDNVLNLIKENWGITDIKTITETTQGKVNKNWIIESSNGKYVLKEIAQNDKINNINFEFSYLRFLENKGFPYSVPQPITSLRDDYIVKGSNDKYFWLYKFIDGNTDINLKESHIKQIALMLAKYHNIIEYSELKNGLSEKYYGNFWILKELQEYLEEIEISKSDQQEDQIMKEYGKVLENIALISFEYEIKKIKTYPLHRDLGGENLVWSNEILIGILDFENVPYYNEPFVKDLSSIIIYSCRKDSRPEESDFDKVKVLLEEYMKIKSINNHELLLIPDLIITGIIEDFNYLYWMFKHEKEKASISRLLRYGKSAIWHYENKNQIISFLSTL